MLDGGNGNDVLAGGAGNDTLNGGGDGYSGGSDTYLFELGGGIDTINENYDYYGQYTDVLKFGAGINPGDISVVRNGNNLEFRHVNGSDKVIVTNWFASSDANYYKLERVDFANGTQWSKARIAVALLSDIAGTSAAETLTGTATSDNIAGLDGNDVISGLDGHDHLNGGLGNDTMSGGMGDDTYYVDVVGDVIVENANEGSDTVISSISYTLGINTENLTLSGTAAINGTGNVANNGLVGNAAANVLDGGAGADLMAGGAGNDTYLVDDVGDSILELLNEGTDTVKTGLSYVLGANLENLTLTGTTAINGTGNELNNSLTGNSAANVLTGGLGNDTLNGGAGTDTMIGGAGNDTYVIDTLADIVTENAGEGTDTVQSGLTYTLGANLENLTLTGTTAINGNGNELNNSITGNSAANILTGGLGNDTLNGGAGADTMIGGVGNDIYVVENTSDVVTENLGEGTDTVQSNLSYTLGANLENLTLTGSAVINGAGNALDNVLTGNAANNTLAGGAGNDSLNGGAGADTMLGGTGNDTYTVDNTLDVITENAGEGVDLVQSSLTWTLGANLENLTLTGTAVIDGTGNELDNVLTGNGVANILTGGAGNDTLNGGYGADTLIGGVGDDMYVVDNTLDIVTEAVNEGMDLVQAGVSHTLAANVEYLTLTGSYSINGTGNGLNNLLRGNTAINTLNGGTGNDILEGGAGNDILTDTSGTALFNGGAGIDSLTGGASAEIFLGGLGNDTLSTGAGNDIVLFNKGDGQDTFATGGTGSDVISLGGGITYADLTFSKSTNDLVLKIGSADQITFKDWYAATPSKPVAKLQVIAEAMADFVQGGSDPLKDQKVENFNFSGLVSAFDAARVTTPGLTSWALTNALANFQLAGSDTAAMGGDLAYQYGKNGTLAGIGVTPALNTLADANLGINPQALNQLSGLQTGSVRLS